LKILDYTKLKHNSTPVSTKNISDAIKHLTKAYNINYDDIVGEVFDEKYSTYDIPVLDGIGGANINGLFKTEEIAVAKVHILAGTKIEAHVHNEVEIIKVLSGCVMVYLGADEIKEHMISAGELLVIDKNVKHYTITDTVDSDILCITLPASKTYPIQGDI